MFVTLLALPLLLPPGVCACRLEAMVTRAPTTCGVQRSACCCCDHDEAATDHHDTARPPNRSCPPFHADCPCHASPTLTLAAAPAAQGLSINNEWIGLPPAASERPAGHALPAPFRDNGQASPSAPLYLLCCDLRC
jgi:hypothetical protein